MSYTEDHLIEQPALQLMEHELGWDSVNAYDEWSSGVSDLGREAKREVVLTGRLKPAFQSLNTELPAEALDAAVEELTRDRSALSLVEANREIDKLLVMLEAHHTPHGKAFKDVLARRSSPETP